MLKLMATVKKSELLSKLQENRSKHAEIVKEARDGYINAAKKALMKKMKKLEDGKIEQLYFSIKPPEAHFEQYDTAIEMLKWTTDEEIELDSVEFRNFVMDKWDWSHGFLVSNSCYSPTASGCLQQWGE